MAEGAAVELLLGLRAWRGCLPVAQWVDRGAAKCEERLCTSACHPDDLVNLHCSATICGAAMHRTPLLQVSLAFQSQCVASGQKV